MEPERDVDSNGMFVYNISCSDDDDDEIFVGKYSLKEAKKQLLMGRQRQTIACVATNSSQENAEKSFKIIDTCSEPDLMTPTETNTLSGVSTPISKISLTPSESDLNSSWDKVSEESFLKVEKMVAMLSVSSNDKENEDVMNNTSEIVKKILNMDGLKNTRTDNHDIPSTDTFLDSTKDQECELDNGSIEKNCLAATSATSLGYFTPAKVEPESSSQQEVFSTPVCQKKTLFKTPAPPTSNKKILTSAKKTPSKLAFQHISSPIASYIKEGPQIPLLKDVKPKKPLPRSTFIPKLKKTPSTSDKENMKLPCVAYKSAKKTTIIDLPEKSVMPSSQWAKKIISSLPKPKVLKHSHREVDFSRERPKPQQEDSFAELSFHQADVSICTQKSAFVKSKK